MKLNRFGCAWLFFWLAVSPTLAQGPENYRSFLTPRDRSNTLQPPQHLRDFVKDGKLRLSLRDAILLTLENNSNVQIEETQIETRKFAVLNAYAPFDPSLQSQLQISRFSYPGYTQLQGVGVSGNATLNSLTQLGQITYSQTFTTGTNLTAEIQSSKNSTNTSFNFFNPYFSTMMNFQFNQPLLRNFGKFANTAPLIIARRSLAESRASFEVEVNDAILTVVTQYWATVQARGALEVNQRSLNLAEVSYERDKRALELGALPPLDISRSESEVAARKVQVIQASYTLAQSEEALRFTIGADRDPQLHSIELELTEKPDPAGELASIDPETALKQALRQRPEIEAAKDSLAIDDTSIRLAKNQLKPNLTVSGFYQGSGLGGNQYSLITGQLLSTGGFGSSFNNIFGYPGYGGTLTLTLPIKNRAGQASLGNAYVSRTHDLYGRSLVEEQITQEIRNATQQLEEAKLALSAGTKSFELAKKTLASEQRKYELGAETNFFVLDAQTRLAQAELVLLQTQVNYQIAIASVGHATGTLLDPYHVTIDQLSR